MQLEKDELQDIKDNEGALEKFLAGVSYPPLDNLVDNKASMEENIKAQAKHNMVLQGEIKSLRDTLLNRVQEYHAKREREAGEGRVWVNMGLMIHCFDP